MGKGNGALPLGHTLMVLFQSKPAHARSICCEAQREMKHLQIGHMPSLKAKVFPTKDRSKLQVSDIPLFRHFGGALGPQSSSFYTFGSKMLDPGLKIAGLRYTASNPGGQCGASRPFPTCLNGLLSTRPPALPVLFDFLPNPGAVYLREGFSLQNDGVYFSTAKSRVSCNASKTSRTFTQKEDEVKFFRSFA